MKLTYAIKLLNKNYERAIRLGAIEKPVSWALFQTWREIDTKEKPRKKVEE